MENVITQRMKVTGDTLKKAERYYNILSAVNDLHLTQKEIQLIAFMAVKGSISLSSVRTEFCREYKTSEPTIYNIISRMKKIGVFTKEDNRVKLNPRISLDFKRDIKLEINLVGDEKV